MTSLFRCAALACVVMWAAPALAAPPEGTATRGAVHEAPTSVPAEAPTPDASPTAAKEAGPDTPEPGLKTPSTQLLDTANLLLLQGENDAARSVLMVLLRRYPHSQEAGRGRMLVAMLGQSAPKDEGKAGDASGRPGEKQDYTREEDDTVELVVGDTIYGMAYGAFGYGAIANGGGGGGIYWSALGGGALGLASGLLLSNARPATPSFVELHLSLQSLAVLHGLEGALAFDASGGKTFGAMALAGVGGALVTAMLGDALEMERGRARFISACWGWGQYFGLMAVVASNNDSKKAILAIPLISDALAVTGAISWPWWRSSRTSLTSLGGVLGALLSGGMVLSLSSPNRPVVGTLFTAGAATGLVAGAVMTRQIPLDPDIYSFQLETPVLLAMPDTEGRMLPGMALRGRF